MFFNLTLAVVVDKVFFIKMFAGYRQYRMETPMFIPSRKSVAFAREH